MMIASVCHRIFRNSLSSKETIRLPAGSLSPGSAGIASCHSPGSVEAQSLTRLLQEWEEAGNPGDMLDGIDSDEKAAMRARVIATEALPTRSGWRIKVPMEVRKLVPPREYDYFVFLLLV